MLSGKISATPTICVLSGVIIVLCLSLSETLASDAGAKANIRHVFCAMRRPQVLYCFNDDNLHKFQVELYFSSHCKLFYCSMF